MFFYAIPDENLLLEGSGGVYEALNQRIRSSFTKVNPMGVKINLEDVGIPPEEFLKELGNKLAKIFEIAYFFEFDKRVLEESLRNIISVTLESQFLDVSYRRIFVVAVIDAFQRIKENNVPINKTTARELFRSTTRVLIQKEREEIEREEF